MHALLLVGEVDRALDLGRHHGLAALVVADPDRLLHAGDAGSGEREADLRLRGLEILRQVVDLHRGLR